MKFKRNMRIRNAIYTALGASFATALMAMPVHAAEEGEAAELEGVKVTGTRLSQVQMEGSNPVTVMTREDLNRVPFDSVGQLLQALPSVSGSPVNTFTNNGGNGSTQVDLRGLGASRTLVLINGRRADFAADLNSIPLAMIERIDVLKEGASAIYGADAVAGVINIVTRETFEGLEVSVQRSNWEVTNAPTTKVSAVMGGNTDRGNIVFGFDFVDQEGAFQAEVDDVPWMTDAIAVFDPEGYLANGLILEGTLQNAMKLGSSSTPGGRFELADGRVLTLDYVDGQNGRAYEDGRDITDFREYTDADSYNFNPVNYIQTPNKRISFFLQGDYEISETARFFSEAQFQRRESAQILAPLPYFGDSGDPGFPLSGALIDKFGASADNYYNPFGEEVVIRRRVVETGGRQFYQTRDAYRLLAGLDGDLGSGWAYEVTYNYSETLRADTDYGQFYGPRLEDALGPSFDAGGGNIVCGNPGADGVPGTEDDEIVDGCVPLNFFGGPGSITQEMMNYVSVALNDRTEGRTDVLNATITGDVLEMPAGWLQTAFGVERRREKLVYVPDSSKNFDVVTGNTGEGTAGSKEIESYFAELAVPLLSDVPFSYSLDLSAGFRHDEFNTFGGADSHMVGLRWQPISDVLIRATVGTSFREPTISNLYSGQIDNFPTASDPCGSSDIADLTPTQRDRCIAQGVPAGGWNDLGVTQLRSKLGGNPNLKPEEGESLTVGVAWAPKIVPGFSIVLDYWDFEIRDAIGTAAEQTILNKCILEGVTEFCDKIVRSQSGKPDVILAIDENLGALTAAGVDLEVGYRHETGFGDFDHRLLVTQLLDRTQQELPGSPVNQLEGQFDNTFVTDSAFPELRMNYTLDWSLNNWGASARLEYTGPMTDENEDVNFGTWGHGEYQFDVDSVLYLDLTGRYYTTTGTAFEFGITNVTDEEPPYIASAFNSNIDESIHRPMGMGYFFRVTQQF